MNLVTCLIGGPVISNLTFVIMGSEQKTENMESSRFAEYCQLPHLPIDASKMNKITLKSKVVANKTTSISLSKLSEYGKKAVVATVFVKSGTSSNKTAYPNLLAVPLNA